MPFQSANPAFARRNDLSGRQGIQKKMESRQGGRGRLPKGRSPNSITLDIEQLRNPGIFGKYN
jgi:hypothetical protein